MVSLVIITFQAVLLYHLKVAGRCPDFVEGSPEHDQLDAYRYKYRRSESDRHVRVIPPHTDSDWEWKVSLIYRSPIHFVERITTTLKRFTYLNFMSHFTLEICHHFLQWNIRSGLALIIEKFLITLCCSTSVLEIL